MRLVFLNEAIWCENIQVDVDTCFEIFGPHQHVLIGIWIRVRRLLKQRMHLCSGPWDHFVKNERSKMACYWYPHWFLQTLRWRKRRSFAEWKPCKREKYMGWFPVAHFTRNVGIVVYFLPTNELHPFTKSTENALGSAAYSIALVELLRIAE